MFHIRIFCDPKRVQWKLRVPHIKVEYLSVAKKLQCGPAIPVIEIQLSLDIESILHNVWGAL
jgi:hypothetical protein